MEVSTAFGEQVALNSSVKENIITHKANISEYRDDAPIIANKRETCRYVEYVRGCTEQVF